MTERVATCPCGQLRIACAGEPVRVSACHCLDCQKRSGSALAVQARWPEERVTLTGASSTWERRGDDGHRLTTYSFCPRCGSTLAFKTEADAGIVAVPVGAFADPTFPSPRMSIYEERKHPWLAVLGDGVEHIA